MSDDLLGFIGGGNMSSAIIGGLLAAGTDPGRIAVAEPSPAQRQQLAARFAGIAVGESNTEVAAHADCIVLAVKPQVLGGVCRELAAIVQEVRPLVVSIAAGVRTDRIDAWLGGGLAVVRVMPNQPALVGRGVSGLYANPATGAPGRERARAVMAAVGQVVEVGAEDDIDTVTAVSGSGPAYFYLLIDMLRAAAEEHGLEAAVARRLAIATAAGAAALAGDTDEPMAELIARVRSPGGTTAAALDSLEADDIRAIFSRAVTAARTRAAELADQADEDG